MVKNIHMNDSVHWYVNDLTSRIITETGIATDKFHLGKIILQCFKDDPEFVNQIDAATGQSEKQGSVLERSVHCATAFKNFGLKYGDVMVLSAPNHLDQAIPFYAALYLGLIISPVDRLIGINELLDYYNSIKPKLIICQSEKVLDNKMAIEQLGLDTKIISFDESQIAENFTQFLIKYRDDTDVKMFKPEEFDPDNTLAILVTTSGTTGTPKAAAVSHKNLAIAGPYVWNRYTQFPSPIKCFMVVSPLQWLSALISIIFGPIMKFIRLQSSLPMTQEHAYHIINTYKPDFTICSPTMLATFLKPGTREKCDFTCFQNIELGGSAVSEDLINEVKEVSPNTEVVVAYGMSEVCTLVFRDSSSERLSCGKPIGAFRYKLVDIDTNKEILEAHTPGELWLKGPSVFKEYYNNPDATRDAFAEDGWLKTGDMFYRDEHRNYFFVERIKLLLKYKNHQISPVEVENVIRNHPAVLDVVVTGIPDRESGDLPVACVVLRPNKSVTAQEIKDLVKKSLTDSKQLRGGVVFLQELPLTASTKIHRTKLKNMVLNMKLE